MQKNTEMSPAELFFPMIEEEAPETNQWWVTIVILTILTLLLAIAVLYFRMKHYQRIGREIYERTKYL